MNHWSFKTSCNGPVPSNRKSFLAAERIRSLTLTRLEREKIEPSAEADRRYVTAPCLFDFIGLPSFLANIDCDIQKADDALHKRKRPSKMLAVDEFVVQNIK